MSGRRVRTRCIRGFTLIELLVVILIVALAGGLASLALRDSAATVLEREAARLQALLEGARAEGRALGLPVRWTPTDEGRQFQFSGLPPRPEPPKQWLNADTRGEVPSNGGMLLLGPEPLIGAQRVVLRYGRQRLELATDGLGPFKVVSSGTEAAP